MMKFSMPVPRTRVLFLTAICAVTLAIVSVNVCWHVASLRNQARREATARCLNRLAQGLLGYAVLHDRVFPGPTYQKAIESLADASVTFDEPGDDLVRDGRDAWGQSIVYERISPGQVILRSVGPNGIDEHGEGDDLQRGIDFRGESLKLTGEGE